MPAFVTYVSATATTTETNFAAASDTFSIANLLVDGPPVGTQVKYRVYAKFNPGAAAIPLRELVLNGPGVFELWRGAAVKDGWYVTHQKLSGADGTVRLHIIGTT